MELRQYVIQIDFIDRFGLGYEIFEVLKRNHINILGTEATADKGMMIKFESATIEEVQDLMASFKRLEGVTGVVFRHHMQCEEREHELRTILNSISEGIIAVDKDGKVSHINAVAMQTMGCTREEVLGQKIDEFFQMQMPLIDILQTGQPYHLKEIRFRRGQRLIHYLTSGVPILDERGEIIGGVATINDYQQVEALISKVGGRKRLTTFEDIIYQSPKMKQVVETAKTVAKGNSTILLRGESGTGKELFARAIHMESHRSNAPFIAINCAALPSTLLESELFGYEEGAFTGAAKGGKKGLFEQASGGTLFLDEIGEISSQVQVSLLRVLQEGTIRRVGGVREIPVDVRIIAATHRNLEEMIHKGDFREDLYYRLNVIPLRIPPLRERVEDIPLIVQHLVHKISTKLNRPEICLTRDSLQLLMNKPWPGNVRQLENVLERMMNMMDLKAMDSIEFNEWALQTLNQGMGKEHPPEANESYTDNGIWGHIPKRTDQSKQAAQIEQRVNDNANRQNAEIQVRRDRPAGIENNNSIHVRIPILGKWPPLKVMMGEVEKRILLAVLEKYPTSRKAGKVLGVSSTTILNKMNAYGITASREDEES